MTTSPSRLPITPRDTAIFMSTTASTSSTQSHSLTANLLFFSSSSTPFFTLVSFGNAIQRQRQLHSTKSPLSTFPCHSLPSCHAIITRSHTYSHYRTQRNDHITRNTMSSFTIYEDNTATSGVSGPSSPAAAIAQTGTSMTTGSDESPSMRIALAEMSINSGGTKSKPWTPPTMKEVVRLWMEIRVTPSMKGPARLDALPLRKLSDCQLYTYC